MSNKYVIQRLEENWSSVNFLKWVDINFDEFDEMISNPSDLKELIEIGFNVRNRFGVNVRIIERS